MAATPATSASGTAAPKSESTVAYPGMTYRGRLPICPHVDQDALVPAVYSERGEVRTQDGFGNADGSAMECKLSFGGTAYGSIRMLIWVHPGLRTARHDYDVRRAEMADLRWPGTRGAVGGLGTRAYGEYKPVSPSSPGVRIQPARRWYVLLQHDNLVMHVFIDVLRPMGTKFPDSDRAFQQKLRQALTGTLANLRAP
ncbi:hypothetical protein GCM10010168_79430 [Actinoplanes ianthinogenes]|uniref:Uncharacterized protein n=1 Tax=Actinoplanes ianthinogenes TaxID=122358 RepID=A0ABM7LK23_9ACTN|nr:hypothetical protein Aiant_02590 [Actinoplanes ianthinogenes]GGR48613.1 hypothetical protein GCM10010168_79430 [Actinoplanes ianthinogenes]